MELPKHPITGGWEESTLAKIVVILLMGSTFQALGRRNPHFQDISRHDLISLFVELMGSFSTNARIPREIPPIPTIILICEEP